MTVYKIKWPPNPIQKNSFTLLKHSKQDSASVAPLHKHNSVSGRPHETTILNEQFQSVFSRKSSNSLSSRCHMKLQESTDADRSMLDITVTSKGIEKLLSNLNHHKVADPDQIKPIILKKTFDSTITNPKTSLPKVARLGNLTTNLEGC